MDRISANQNFMTIAAGSTLEDVNTANQAEAYLKVNRDTLNRLCRLGQLGYVTVGKERRYTRTHLLDFINRQSRHAELITLRAIEAARPKRRGGPRTTRTFG
jgi:hypothetical protein